MIRSAHRLKDNRNSAYPSKFIFFDTETTQTEIEDNCLEHYLRLGCALFWERRSWRDKDTLIWCHFTTADQFWDFVEAHTRSRDRVFIIAHNIAFDMGIVEGFAQLEKRNYELVKMILDFRKNIWKFRKDTSSLVFLDNMNYFDTTLEKLGQSVGLEKLPMPAMDADDDEWRTYNKRDVEVLYHTWQHWLSFLIDNDLGSFGLTMAAQAFNAYRHKFMSKEVYIHTSKTGIELERNSYRGGRVECYRIGELPSRDYYILDVNSMYAYMLKTYAYPTNLISTGKKVSLHYLKKWLASYCVIATVIVNTPEPCFGIKFEGRLVFPIGQFEASLNSCELIYGLEHGYILSVSKYAVYEKSVIFDSYVDFFFAKRLNFIEEGNEVYNYLCKKLLNSLYGKFGQRIEEWKSVGYDKTRLYDYWTEWDTVTRTMHTFRCLNHWVEEKIGASEGYNSFVAIPAEATAYARMYLWQLITLAGSDHIYYCDTDSLIVDRFGLANLKQFIDPTQLGLLKIEDKARKLIIHGLKDYQFGNKIVIKGVPKNAKKIADDIYETYQSIGIKSGLHRQELNRVLWKRVTKTLKRQYKKGIIDSYGKVSPLIIKYSVDANWLDGEAMLTKYGELAHYANKYVDELMGIKYTTEPQPGAPMADYRPVERYEAEVKDLEERRHGEKLYQRGKRR